MDRPGSGRGAARCAGLAQGRKRHAGLGFSGCGRPGAGGRRRPQLCADRGVVHRARYGDPGGRRHRGRLGQRGAPAIVGRRRRRGGGRGGRHGGRGRVSAGASGRCLCGRHGCGRRHDQAGTRCGDVADGERVRGTGNGARPGRGAGLRQCAPVCRHHRRPGICAGPQ